MSFGMREDGRNHVMTLLVSGELDMASAPALQRRIDELIRGGRTRIVIDLHDLTF